MIALVNYGMGNLQSVANAFEAIGCKLTIISEPSQLAEADAIVLPGVGAFGDAMLNLKNCGLDVALTEEVLNKKKPFLGICLGLQLLADQGFEHGKHDGLKNTKTERYLKGIRIVKKCDLSRPSPKQKGEYHSFKHSTSYSHHIAAMFQCNSVIMRHAHG